MKLMVLSVQESTFKDDKTGQERRMWRAYCPDETGAVGSVYSTEPVKTGDSVEVKLLVNRDGKFAPKIIHPKKDGQAR